MTSEDLAPFVPLQTARLTLRCPDPGDVKMLAALVTPAISRWMASWPFPFTLPLAEGCIEAARAAGLARQGMRCVIERDAAIIGWIEIKRSQSITTVGSLGYWIGEAHQGHGYSREAAESLIPAAFSFLDLDSIEAGAQPENLGSFAVMRALGMHYLGERLVYAAARGRDETCLFYALERRQPAVAREV